MTKSCKSVLLKRMIHMEQEIQLEKHRNDGAYRAVCVRANLKTLASEYFFQARQIVSI